jgi:(R,R)-butanediol dehydrogenase/meso-butanediol dehydrogenase/diacetyl reductase
MKAAAFKQQNEMTIIDAPKPTAKAGEVVLKVHNCGICGSDLHACQYGFGMASGSIMGHEFCGEIAEVGAGVRNYTIGQRVCALPFVMCGECDRCKRGMEIHCHNLKGLGLGQLPGAYAEFVACATTSLFRLPDNVNSRDGALVEPLSVGLHAVKRAGIKRGDTALVMGAGPIGLATMTWAKGKGRYGRRQRTGRRARRTRAQAWRRRRNQSQPVQSGGSDARDDRAQSGTDIRMYRH